MSEKSQARIENLEHNEKKKKRIFTFVVVLLILIFLGGMVLGIQKVLLTEGTYDLTETHSYYEQPTDEDGVTALFYKHILDAANCDKAKFSVYTNLDIAEDSIDCGDNDKELAKVIAYLRGDVLSKMKESCYKDYEGKFGTDGKAELIMPTFMAADTSLAKCFIGESEEDGTAILDEHGEQKNPQNYYIKLRFPDRPLPKSTLDVLYSNFDMSGVNAVIDKIKSEYAGVFSIDSLDIRCSGFGIDADSERESGKINYACYKRSYLVTAHLTFAGEYAALGSRAVSFRFTAKREYFFAWAGVSLDKSTVSIDKGGSEQLMAYRTADTQLPVVWESSDPEIVSVDEDGYIKGKVRSAEPVIITASVEYLGNTYTDECTVYVRKAVKKIDISTRKLTVKVGEGAKLDAAVSPDKATIKDIVWIALDESIASVDEDGFVHGIAPGTAEVIAVSKDGSYKATCTVTVE